MKWPQFSKQWAQSHTLAQFEKQHEHLAKDFDLKKVWQDLQDKVEKPKPTAEQK